MCKDTQSKIADSSLKFLDIYHFKGELEYAGKNGEHTVLLREGILKVDGYLILTNTIFEFYGRLKSGINVGVSVARGVC